MQGNALHLLLYHFIKTFFTKKFSMIPYYSSPDFLIYYSKKG